MRTLAAVKSLLAFGQRTGYLALNVGAALKLPPKKDRLAERILSETQVHRILALEPSKRNPVLLRLLYAGGLRVSELAALRWRDLQPRDDAGQVTILGSGNQRNENVRQKSSAPDEVTRAGGIAANCRLAAIAETPMLPSHRGARPVAGAQTAHSVR